MEMQMIQVAVVKANSNPDVEEYHVCDIMSPGIKML